MPTSAPTRRLPPQPNLEQLRNQAKDLLEHYRAGDLAAVNEVKQFEWRADPVAFALNDAQRVLARAYGFESWPKLKAFVDGANVKALAEAVNQGDSARVRVLLNARPELATMDMSGGDERRALHFAVLRRDSEMVKLLMEAGADARKGVYPHRDATSPLAIARDRGYREIEALIEEEERHRRAEMSCPNATISPVQDQISAAIHSGNTAEAIRLLNADKSLIQACDGHGGTALHIAAQAGNEELITWLLQRRANVHKEDVYGLTPLDRAALVAHPENDLAQRFPAIARQLLDQGAEVTIRASVALANEQRIRELIGANQGLLREIGPRGRGLLTIAVNHGHLNIVRLLLDLGADVDERVMLDELEEPTLSWGGPLWHAALAGNADIAQLLLDRGADPNSNVYASGWPLRNAWNQKDQTVKRLLLERGAKLQPYMIAELREVDQAKKLLETNPDEQVVAELLDAGGDSGCPEIVELALARIDWPRTDPKWHWYLIQPIRGIGANQHSHEGHFRSMQLLLRHGIDPNIAVFGQTTLHFAAAWHGDVNEAERARFAAMLLDHGARFDLRDEMLRSTPLGWACRWGRKEMVALLIARGAPIDELDAEPWATPTAWAQKMAHRHVLAVLRQHGLRLRLATVEDVPAIQHLIAESVHGLQANDYSQAQVRGALGTIYGADRTMIADRTFFVVEDGGAIVGCGGWSRRRTAFGSDESPVKDDAPLDPEVDPAKIRGFFVHPSWARQGIGSRILLASEEAARSAGFKCFELVSTLTGVPLYQRHGYVEVERVTLTLPNAEPYEAVRMRKD